MHHTPDQPSPSLPTVRHAHLAALLRQRGTLRVRDVVAAFGVGRATAQRDLDHLAELEGVRRTHGGVMLAELAAPAAIRLEARQGMRQQAKACIARRALRALAAADTLYLDAGTTTLALARALAAAPRHPSWVVTNAWHVAECLCRAGIRHELLGGEVDPNSLAIAGTTALQTLHGYQFDWAVIAADAVTAAGSIRVARPPEAALKRAAAAAGTRTMLLADSDKFLNTAHVEALTLPEITCWVTDRATAEMQALCGAHGVALLAAEEGR